MPDAALFNSSAIVGSACGESPCTQQTASVIGPWRLGGADAVGELHGVPIVDRERVDDLGVALGFDAEGVESCGVLRDHADDLPAHGEREAEVAEHPRAADDEGVGGGVWCGGHAGG